MLCIWGKRSYGSVQSVGNTSVKTVFGHFWYLPLFPMASYYVAAKKSREQDVAKLREMMQRAHELPAQATVRRIGCMVPYISVRHSHSSGPKR